MAEENPQGIGFTENQDLSPSEKDQAGAERVEEVEAEESQAYATQTPELALPETVDGCKRVLEAVLMAANKVLSLDQIAGLFDVTDTGPRNRLKDALAQLELDYSGRGVELKRVAGGYRFQTSLDAAPYVSRLWEERPQRYSRALLETLALIAYRQPITRGEIEDVRGVSVSSHIMKTLLERQWVRVIGHREVPGRPAIYATTKTFLDYFNLSSLDQLPPLSELRDIDAIARDVSEQLELTVDESGSENEAESEEQGSESNLITENAQNTESLQAVGSSDAGDEASSPKTDGADVDSDSSDSTNNVDNTVH